VAGGVAPVAPSSRLFMNAIAAAHRCTNARVLEPRGQKPAKLETNSGNKTRRTETIAISERLQTGESRCAMIQAELVCLKNSCFANKNCIHGRACVSNAKNTEVELGF